MACNFASYCGLCDSSKFHFDITLKKGEYLPGDLCSFTVSLLRSVNACKKFIFQGQSCGLLLLHVCTLRLNAIGKKNKPIT